jgi:hypothetical protein
MHCFVHQNAEAVGLCRQCFKAVCPACARPSKAGIACSEECEKLVSEYAQVLEATKGLQGVGSGKKGSYFLLVIWMGLGLFGISLFQMQKYGFEYAAMGLFMGAVFTIFGLVEIRKRKKHN